MEHQSNTALLQYQLDTQQEVIYRMVPIVEGLVITTNNLVTSQKMFSEQQNKLEPKVEQMWDSQNKVKGGYATIVGMCMIASAVAGFLAAIVTIHHVQ